LAFRRKDFFDLNRCTLCGKCLAECPVLGYTEEKARAEMKRLIEGVPSEVLEHCKSCFSCNRFCPHDCHPYGLILFRWFERYRRDGIPVRALAALPADTRNFLTAARKAYHPRERTIVREWRDNARSDLSGEEVIFAGCNAQIFPYLFESPLLAGKKVIGEPGLCCGEIDYRMGLFDRVESLARRLEDRYRRVDPGRVILFCPAGYNMQKNVLPDQFGIRLAPEIVYLGDWLLEKADRGEIRFTKPLRQRVVVQDSCHAKILGDSFMEVPRELLRRAGAEITEMSPCRERQICCGVADGIPRLNPLDMARGGLRQWRLAEASGAEIFAPYCAACYLNLKLAQALCRPSIPCRHFLEILSDAAGHPLRSLAAERARRVLVGTVLTSGGRLLSKKRLFPQERESSPENG
jgi:Fe-S oxidoreductase